MKLSTANYSQYKSLQSFATIEALNESIRAFLYKHTHILPESAVNVLKLLARHSCKIVGVSFLKVDTIAKSLGISTRTVRRALKVLSEEYGVIERRETIRTEGKLRGGNGHNVYVIKSTVSADVLPDVSPRKVDEMPTGTSVEAPKSESETVLVEADTLVELKNEKNVRETSSKIITVTKPIEAEVDNEVLDESYTPSEVPSAFVKTVAPFFNNAVKIYELYQRVVIAKKRCRLEHPIGDVIDEAIAAFKETIFAKKLGRIQTTFNGYFYRIIEAKFTEERRREVKASGGVLAYDWLAEG
jgi:predicted transcriptional regulator